MRLIAFGVALWSVATAVGGLVDRSSRFSWRVQRSASARRPIGTISPAVLADYFAPATRGRIMSIFLLRDPDRLGAGICAGRDGGLSFRLAGGVLRGWCSRPVAGAPGVRRAGPPRGMWDGEPRAKPDPIQSKFAFALHSYGALRASRTYVLTCAGLAAYTFALGGIATWPAFVSRAHSGRAPRAGIVASWSNPRRDRVRRHVWRRLARDKLLTRSRQAYLWLSGVATLVATPDRIPRVHGAFTRRVLVGDGGGRDPVVRVHRTDNATTVNIVSPTMRATAMAAQIFLSICWETVPSPPLIGAISDASSLRLRPCS